MSFQKSTPGIRVLIVLTGLVHDLFHLSGRLLARLLGRLPGKPMYRHSVFYETFSWPSPSNL